MTFESSLTRYRARAAAGVVAVLLVVTACSSTKEPEYADRPVDDLYNEAMDNMEKKQYEEAAKLFDEVERQHPYSTWAVRSQVMAAFAHYQANEYDDCVLSADRFIDLNPAHQDVAYAFYLKGLCYYERISTVDRDQEMTEMARRTFEELIARYPESQYSRDARIKLDLTIDHLAGKEMDIGRYYLKQKFYLAAINRFKNVIDRYQTTTHVPEALLRLTEAYSALGLNNEAKKTASVLGYNFPDSEWYADAYGLVGGGQEPERTSWYRLW